MAGEIAQRIGQRIRDRRVDLGLNQRELADKLPPAVSNQHVSNWERGVNRPSDRNLERIATALDVEVGFFYADGEPAETPDVLGALASRTGHDAASQLDRVERKLDALLEGLNALDPRVGELTTRLLEGLEAPDANGHAQPDSPPADPPADRPERSRRRGTRRTA